MKMLNHWYEIPDGYQVVTRTKRIDILDIESMLQGRKQDRCTQITRDGDFAVLTQHIILCPHCRKSRPAYPRYLDECFGTYTPPWKRITTEAIDAWGSTQYSFFPKEEDTLVFNPVYNPNNERYRCPYCKEESREIRTMYHVMSEFRKNKVSVMCRSNDLGDLFKIQWGCRTAARLTFPLTESIVFNFRSGKAYIRLCNNCGEMLAVRSIVKPEDWESSAVYKLMKENTLVKRITAQAFRMAWNAALPCTTSELTPDLLLPLCTYIGYPQEFYLRIPYAAGEYRVDRSFAAVAKKVHTVQNLKDLLKQPGVSWSKSVRKIVYQNPVYAFYLPEWEILYDCIGNIDIFLRLFNRPFTFSLVTFLHQYPGNMAYDTGVACFFRDYVQHRGPQALLRKMERHMSELQAYAVHYACMNAASRKREQIVWRRGDVCCRPSITFSVPMPISSIPDTQINGYEFVLLKTKKQYQEAGKALHNCLTEWKSSNNPVFAVKENGEYLAAIELRDDTTVLQVLGKHNLPIPRDSMLYSAYEKWKRTYYLDENQDEYDEDDYGHIDILSQLDHTCF